MLKQTPLLWAYMQTFRTHQKSDPQNLFWFTTSSSKYKNTFQFLTCMLHFFVLLNLLSVRELWVKDSCKEMGSSERSLSEEHILEFQVEEHLSNLRYLVVIRHFRFLQNFSNLLFLAIFSMTCRPVCFLGSLAFVRAIIPSALQTVRSLKTTFRSAVFTYIDNDDDWGGGILQVPTHIVQTLYFRRLLQSLIQNDAAWCQLRLQVVSKI